MPTMIKLLLVTTDNREQQKHHDRPEPWLSTPVESLVEGFAAHPDEIEVHIVSCAKRRMPGTGRIGPNLVFHQPIVPLPGWGRSLFAGCAIAVRRLARQLDVDLVHGQGTERDCAISAVCSGKPNVLTIHGNMERIHRMNLQGARAYYWMISRLETFALGRTGGVLCNSAHTRELVAPRTHRTWMVPNPLRKAFLEPPAERPVRSDPPTLLVVGVISRLKRSLEILDAFERLHREGHRFHLRYIGKAPPGGEFAARFHERIEQATHEGYASFAGPIDEQALARAMDQADALVHFPAEESFGLVIAEALARELKVFTARVGGIPDVIADCAGAEWFDDLDALRGRVGTWIAAGCPRIPGDSAVMRGRYAPKVVAARHLELYREVLGEAHRASHTILQP